MKYNQPGRTVRLEPEDLVFFLGLSECVEAIIAEGKRELRKPARKFKEEFLDPRIHKLKRQRHR